MLIDNDLVYGVDARNRGRSKLKAYCGVHVITIDEHGEAVPLNKQFARRRKNQTANWSPSARQALYLLGDQFNRNPKSDWGKRLRENKKRQRALHPEVVEEEVINGNKEPKKVRRFTDMHIQKRAYWRTLSQFVEWLFDEWTRIEIEAERSNSK